MMRNFAEKFWRRVNKTETCWLWTSYTNADGYGVLQVNNKDQRAHRISLILTGTEIPEGMVVDHKCRVRNCVNPEHLRLVTPIQNTVENSLNFAALNKQKTHCSKGHLLSPDNLCSCVLKRGGRYCLTCKRETDKLAKRKKSALVAAVKNWRGQK